MKLTSFLLAGGQNKRMGGVPKWELELGKEKMLERSIRNLRRISDNIFIISGGEHQIILSEHKSAIKIIYDDKPHLGPLNGVLTGLKNSSNEFNFVAASDMPFLSIDLAVYMHQVAITKKASLVVPIWKGKIQPLHGIYSRNNIGSIKKDLEQGKYSLVKWISQQKDVLFLEEKQIKEVTKDDRIFFNMNYPDDYEKALKWIEEKDE